MSKKQPPYRITCTEGVKVYILEDTEGRYPREFISPVLPDEEDPFEPIAELCVPKELYEIWEKEGYPDLIYY